MSAFSSVMDQNKGGVTLSWDFTRAFPDLELILGNI